MTSQPHQPTENTTVRRGKKIAPGHEYGALEIQKKAKRQKGWDFYKPPERPRASVDPRQETTRLEASGGLGESRDLALEERKGPLAFLASGSGGRRRFLSLPGSGAEQSRAE